MSDFSFLIRCDHCKFKKRVNTVEEIDLTPVTICSSCSGSKKYKCPSCGYVAKLVKQSNSNITRAHLALDRLRQQLKERKVELEEEKRNFNEK